MIIPVVTTNHKFLWIISFEPNKIVYPFQVDDVKEIIFNKFSERGWGILNLIWLVFHFTFASWQL